MHKSSFALLMVRGSLAALVATSTLACKVRRSTPAASIESSQQDKQIDLAGVYRVDGSEGARNGMREGLAKVVILPTGGGEEGKEGRYTIRLMRGDGSLAWDRNARSDGEYKVKPLGDEALMLVDARQKALLTVRLVSTPEGLKPAELRVCNYEGGVSVRKVNCVSDFTLYMSKLDGADLYEESSNLAGQYDITHDHGMESPLRTATRSIAILAGDKPESFTVRFLDDQGAVVRDLDEKLKGEFKTNFALGRGSLPALVSADKRASLSVEMRDGKVYRLSLCASSTRVQANEINPCNITMSFLVTKRDAIGAEPKGRPIGE